MVIITILWAPRQTKDSLDYMILYEVCAIMVELNMGSKEEFSGCGFLKYELNYMKTRSERDCRVTQSILHYK